MKQMSIFDSFLRKTKTNSKEMNSEAKKMQETNTVEKNTAEKNQAENHNHQNIPNNLPINNHEEEGEN